ncbi:MULTISPECIES: DsbA family protein [Salinibaculum]|uniref:DsbA family protein n=1 Tax=Salinibaculum TaxID=2732368 RepID=UPI0030CDF2F8
MDDSSMSRRRLLLGVGTGAAALAGCLGGNDGQGGDGTDGSEPTVTSGPTPTMTDGRLPAPVLGDPEASVTLAVYEDYACPHCADYNASGFDELASEFIDSGDIRYEHRDAPIPVADPGSWQAASAAREVQARHGNAAFWAYAKKLFENHRDLRGNVRSLFERLVNDLGLDGAEAVATAGVDRAHDPTVRADRQMAGQVGIQGTPAFVINGQIVTSGFGSSTVDTVSSALDDALSESA